MNLSNEYFTLFQNVRKSNSVDVESTFYDFYSNKNNQGEKINLELNIPLSIKQKTRIDKGWVLKEFNNSYLGQLNKFLISKAGHSVLVNPQDFLVNQSFSNEKTKYIDIYQRAFFENDGWIWFNSEDYLNFQNILRIYIAFKKNQTLLIRSFVKNLIRILDVKKIPYQFKVESKLSDRYENAVLYFQKEHYFLVFIIIRALHVENTKLFRDAKPLFTYKTGLNGISFAEDPNEPGVSFGDKRAKVLAEIFEENHNSGIKILNSIKKKGYNPKEFFRNPGENYPYAFIIFRNEYFKDSDISNLSYIEKRYDRSVKNIDFVIELSKVILKNAIFKNNNGQIELDWLIGAKDEMLPSNIIYRLCNNSEKLEVIYFLAELYSKSTNDGILKITCKIGLESLNFNILEESEKTIYNKILLILSGEVGGPEIEEIIKTLGNGENFDGKLKLVIEEFKMRGVLTWHPDDAFDPTYSNFGYAYLGLTILLQKEEN